MRKLLLLDLLYDTRQADRGQTVVTREASRAKNPGQSLTGAFRCSLSKGVFDLSDGHAFDGAACEEQI